MPAAQKFGEAAAGAFHKTKKRLSKLPSDRLLLYFHSFYFLYGKSLSILLCNLRMDNDCRIEYNKARNQTSTAEVQMRTHPADFKKEGAKTDG